MIWKKLFWIFAAILPFSFALNPTSQIDLQVVRILVPVLFLLWLADSLAKNKLLLDRRARFLFLAGLLALAGVSFFWSLDESRALRKILFLFSLAPLYLVSFDATRDPNERLSLFKVIAWSATMAALTALVHFGSQFIFGIDPALAFATSHLAPFFLGNVFSEVVLAFPSWLVNIGGTTLMRAFGTFPDPHLFSLYCNLALVLVAYLYASSKNKLYLVMGSILLISSLTAFSRAAYLSLICGGLFILLTSRPIQKASNNFVLLVIGFFALASFLFFPNPLTSRLLSTFDLGEGSNQGRIEMWRQGYQTMAEYPLGGVGIGNFSRYIEPTSVLRDPIYAHNLFLDMGAELGYLGALLAAILFIAPIMTYFRKPTLLKKYLAAAMVIFLVHCLFETPIYSVRVFPLVLILLSINANE